MGAKTRHAGLGLIVVMLTSAAVAQEKDTKEIDRDTARCEAEAWRVTGRQINPAVNGNLTFNKDSFDYYVLCMIGKGYTGPDEPQWWSLDGYCDHVAAAMCWR